MSLEFSYDELRDSSDAEIQNQFHIKDSIIFLIDGTKQMYEGNYILQCLETYKNIVRQKCSFNKKDKMGLFLFGTEDQSSDITALQKFDTVSVETLKNIISLLKDGINKYKDLASDSKYPLLDALSHVYQVCHATKTNTKTRNVIVLCTCNDNPLSNSAVDRRRIEHLVATFKDTETELRVIGLSSSWDDNLYYKDLQVISGTYSNDEYKRTYLKDLEDNILNPARSICRLPWKISSNISVEVSLINLIAAPKYPSKVKLSKGDNQILESRNVLREENLEEDEYENSEENKSKVISSDSIIFYKTYGGSDIHFTPEECKKVKNLGLEPSIEILAFKPITCDPLNHSKSPNFVTYTKTCSDESKIFFKSLINKCAEKKVMAICKVVTKTTIMICMMIPSEDDGGFYMYKIPFNDCYRDYDDLLNKYIYDSEDNKCPVNTHAVHTFKKLIGKTRIEFDIKTFKNPKLQKCIAYIEALALDEKLGPLPPDSTNPPPPKEDLEQIITTLTSILNLEKIQSKQKRSKPQSADNNKRPKLDLKDAAETGQLGKLTVADLRDFLKSVNITNQGNKSVLIERVKAHYNV